MNITSVEDIINLIAQRDNISYFEALVAVRECINEMEEAVEQGYWQKAEDILMSNLSLEPDYLDILMTEIF